MASRKIDREAVVKSDFKTKKDKELHDGGYRTACTYSILSFYGIEKTFKFCQFTSDMARIFRRNGWRMKPVRKPVGGKHFSELNLHVARGFYCVEVEGHVFLAYVDDKGELSFPVDVAPAHKEKKTKMIRAYKIERDLVWEEKNRTKKKAA
jgi:hypothetical protein